MNLRPSDIESVRGLFSKVAVVLLQLEIPVPAVARAVALGSAGGALILLNPAPGAKLPARLLRKVDVLTPNETEAGLMTGRRVTDMKSATKAARDILHTGVRHVVITLGSRGCLLATGSATTHFPAPRVRPIDTTAAGDAFNGALAHGLASGMDISAALPLANKVAAFAVTKMGAQDSMPTMHEVRRYFG
jgi:ribokinase